MKNGDGCKTRRAVVEIKIGIYFCDFKYAGTRIAAGKFCYRAQLFGGQPCRVRRGYSGRIGSANRIHVDSPKYRFRI